MDKLKMERAQSFAAARRDDISETSAQYHKKKEIVIGSTLKGSV